MARLPQQAGAISFQFLAEIAVGTTARIDLCRAVGGERHGQLLAVKRLLPHIAEDPNFSNMFLDEVWMTAALKHPNVVEVAGWGQDAQGAYLAVELVQGVSLARLMKTVFDTGEVFSERMVVFMVSKICRGLDAAHALRSPDGELLYLVHRDLTPGNVLVGFNGDVKIADFGLAKAKQRLTKTLTGLLKGQPQYMSPEQAKGGVEIDGRSDLFSLGVVMFELFAARRPWSATSELEMVHVAATEPPVDLREYRPKIDKELVAVVTGCLQRDPGARFQSAGEVQQRLETWLATHGYAEGTEEALARFVRRNAMRQMRWFERAVAGELAPMPDSMRPAPPSAAQPRVPSYTNATNAPIASQRGPVSSGSIRARVRPRRPVDSETTDVTDVESRVAAMHAESGQSPPLIVDKEERPASWNTPPRPTGDIDWGEEIPTLVQKQAQNAAGLMERARVRPRPAAGAKPPFEPPGILDEDSQRTTAVKRPQQQAFAQQARAAEEIADMESEEVPTLPLKRGLHRPRLNSAPTIEHGRAGPSSQRLPGQVAPATPGVPPPPIPTRRDGATPSGIRVAEGMPPSTPLPPRGPINEEVLLAEADRLAVEAVRLGEEARAAAATAVRRTTMAKIAGDAAMIAAEAVRIAATAGLAHGARRLEEALSLEAALRRGEISPGSMPTSSAPPAPPPPPSTRQMLPDPAHMSPFDTTGPLRALPDAAVTTGDLFRTTFDPQMFRAQLKPELFGMPRPVAIALMLVAFVAFIVFLWVVF